jgi:hypothetical protein
MIKLPPDAVPISHISPYKRIDPCHPGRKTVITMIEVMRNGGRPPDAALYQYDFLREVFTLKDGV